jgi:EAL domain-containing protein (putative c-di-GMP-specific phosphodiesterase class I)
MLTSELPQVFIAYARENADQAQALFNALEQRGCDPWLDTARLSPGANWKAAIRRAIKTSDFFVPCLSTDSVSKIGFFQRELRDAFDILQEYPDENIYLIPVRLDDCVVPEALQDRQWVDLFVAGGEERLITALHREWETRRRQAGSPALAGRASPASENAALDRETLLMDELRAAVERDELLLHYQPKVHLGTNHVVGVESLVRWNHPRRGLLAPDLFLPAAERTGVIDIVTPWVLNHALEQCAIWERAGLEIGVGVNVSGRNFRLSDQLLQIVEKALRRWKVPPASLQLEITETAVLDDLEKAKKMLMRLRRIGVRVAIDDFGTGQSALNKLNELLLDEVKLDRPFVTDFVESQSKQSIVNALVQMSHDLGMKVIAEGVESQPTLGLLLAMHCDSVQGYLLTEPLPPRDFVKWLVDSPWTVEWRT